MPKTKYVDNGASVHIIKHDVSNIKENLPSGLWKVAYHQLTGFYLTKQLNDFELPSQIFGSSKKQLELITSRFERDSKSMGVLLTGDKGTGKTLLATQIINHYINNGYPVILMTESFDKMESALSEFISQISNAVFLFDEFEKVFTKTGQQYLLNFFDDKANMNRLSVAVSNSPRISEFMLSRPSRFFYHFKYSKLDNETIHEVTTHFGFNKTVYDNLIMYKERLQYFGFDILMSIIDELQFRKTTDVAEVIETMNIDLVTLNVLKKYEVTKLNALDSHENSYTLKDVVSLRSDSNGYFVLDVNKRDDEGKTIDSCYDCMSFLKTAIVNYNPDKSEFIYQIDLEQNDEVYPYVIHIKEKEVDYKHLLY